VIALRRREPPRFRSRARRDRNRVACRGIRRLGNAQTRCSQGSHRRTRWRPVRAGSSCTEGPSRGPVTQHPEPASRLWSRPPTWLFPQRLGTRMGTDGGLQSHMPIATSASTTKNRLLAGGLLMARPGLEPGTPRFSVVGQNLSNSGGTLQIRQSCGTMAEEADRRKLRSFLADLGNETRFGAQSDRSVAVHAAAC
jgi:hypothetical protein